MFDLTHKTRANLRKQLPSDDPTCWSMVGKRACISRLHSSKTSGLVTAEYVNMRASSPTSANESGWRALEVKQDGLGCITSDDDWHLVELTVLEGKQRLWSNRR